MIFFLGLMRVATEGGLLRAIARGLAPLLRRLFPDVPADHPAMGAMVMNLASNMLGLGNAATPFGLKAMVELEPLEPASRRRQRRDGAVPRDQRDRVTLLPPTGTDGGARGRRLGRARWRSGCPTLIATTCSTLAAVAVGLPAARAAALRRARRCADAPAARDAGSRARRRGGRRARAARWRPRSPPARRAARWSWASRRAARVGARARAGATPRDAAARRRRDAMLQQLALRRCSIARPAARRRRRARARLRVDGGGRARGPRRRRAHRPLPGRDPGRGRDVPRLGRCSTCVIARSTPSRSPLGFPAEALPMALLRPLSGSGAFAVMSEILTDARAGLVRRHARQHAPGLDRDHLLRAHALLRRRPACATCATRCPPA